MHVEGILNEGLGRSVRLGIVRVARVQVLPGKVGSRRRLCLGGPVQLLTVKKRTGLPSHFIYCKVWVQGYWQKTKHLNLDSQE